jgi:hypothetical protein
MRRYLFTVSDPAGTEIGEIYKDEAGFGTVPFYGDIGHDMMDTFNEAVRDLLQIYHEHTGNPIHPRSSFSIKKITL